MPIYEFDCGEPFEELVFSFAAVTEVVCPTCGSPKVKKKLSTFATRVKGGASAPFSSSAASCAPGSL